MYKAPSFGLGMKKDLRESIESVYNINNSINEEEQLIISLFEEFLEENFHVEMLTEEDLDYVFENEFPQWLEEEKLTESTVPKRLEVKPANQTGLTPQQRKETMRRVRSVQGRGEYENSSGKSSVKQYPGKEKGNWKESDVPYADEDETDAWKKANNKKVNTEDDIRKKIEQAKKEVNAKTPAKKPARKQVRRSAPKPQSFGALLRKVGGNAPATSDTAAGRRKIKLLDARAKARTAARDAIVRKTGRGQLSWAKKAFNPDGN
jgi:hypothetical protein